LGEEEVRLTKRSYGWPRMKSSGARGCLRALRERHRRAWRRRAGRLDGGLHATSRARALRTSRAECSAVSCRTLGRDRRGLRARREGTSRPRRLRAGAERVAPNVHGSSAVPQISPSTKAAHFRQRRRLSADDRHGRNLHFGVRGTRRVDPNGLALSKIRPWVRP
jgi:hypothetical protein